jgi:O-antigen/teichoic acid export membrane protein
MADNLRQKTVGGLAWSLIDNIANQGITFVVGIVLARLITPEEYGMIGVILIFIALFNSIVDSGFSNALIRKKNATNIDYNTIFFVNLGVSILLYVLLFYFSPLVGIFFHQAKLILLLKVTGVIVIINALTIIQRTILVKAIDFKTQAKASLLSSILSGVGGIVAASLGFGVWSLVLQQILRQVLYSSVLWINNHWRPQLLFSLSSLKDLFGFGWKIAVSGIINTLWQELYQIIIGRYYTIATLGQYTRAKQFSDGVTYGLLTVIQRVSYPSLSSIQESDYRMREALRKIVKMTMYILAPLIIGLCACSTILLDVLIGDQWSEAAEYLQIICFGILFSPLRILDENALQVKKQSGLVLALNIIGKTFAVFPIVLGIMFNIKLMLVASAIINTFIMTPLVIAMSTGKYLNYGIKDHLCDLYQMLIVALSMGFLVFTLSYINASSIVVLFLQLVAGVLFYIIASKLLKISEYEDLKSIILSYIKKYFMKKSKIGF